MRQNLEDSENLERIADALDRLVIAADSIATTLGMQTLQGLTTPSLPDFIARIADCPVKECPGKVYAQFFAAQGQPGASTAPDASTQSPARVQRRSEWITSP